MQEKDRNYANAAKLAEMPQMQAGTAGRLSTKAMLLEGAERLRREAHQLEALAYAVEYVSGDAETMLHRLLSAHIYR